MKKVILQTVELPIFEYLPKLPFFKYNSLTVEGVHFLMRCVQSKFIIELTTFKTHCF